MVNRVVVCSALVIVLVTGCADTHSDSAEAERQFLEQRQSEFFEAMASKDAEKTASIFSESAVMQVAGMPPIEGRDAIRQFYGNMFGFLSATSATPESTHVSESGDMAYSIGRTSNEFSGPQATTEYTGKYLLVWQNVDDEWLVVAYSISSNEQGGDG